MTAKKDFNAGATVKIKFTSIKHDTGNKDFPVMLEGNCRNLGRDVMFLVPSENVEIMKEALYLLPRVKSMAAHVKVAGDAAGEPAGFYLLTALKP